MRTALRVAVLVTWCAKQWHWAVVLVFQGLPFGTEDGVAVEWDNGQSQGVFIGKPATNK